MTNKIMFLVARGLLMFYPLATFFVLVKFIFKNFNKFIFWYLYFFVICIKIRIKVVQSGLKWFLVALSSW